MPTYTTTWPRPPAEIKAPWPGPDWPSAFRWRVRHCAERAEVRRKLPPSRAKLLARRVASLNRRPRFLCWLGVLHRSCMFHERKNDRKFKFTIEWLPEKVGTGRAAGAVAYGHSRAIAENWRGAMVSHGRSGGVGRSYRVPRRLLGTSRGAGASWLRPAGRQAEQGST